MRNGHRIVDAGFGIGFIEAFVVRFQVNEMQEILRFDVGEEPGVFVVIENDIEILIAADG